MKTHSALKTLAIVAGSACIVAVVVIGFLLYWVTGPGYYAELNAVRDQLERMPQIQITELNGVHDLTLEHIWAQIRIEGKGEMKFFGLDRDSFRYTRHLRLCSVGPYLIRVGGEGYVGVVESATGKPVRSEFFGGDVDIGPEGEFARMFPFQITNVQTAVAHYDDICRVIGAWPPQSSKRSFRDAKGTDFFYYIETKGVQPDGPANRSQPMRSDTNRTSSAAGSGR